MKSTYLLQNGHTEVVQLLLGHGAAKDAADSDGNTPLRAASLVIGGGWGVQRVCA